MLILAGADVSGNEFDGQRRYLSFVIGTEEKINSLYKEIGLKQIHMIRLDEKQRKHVINTLDFTKSDILALCLEVDKQFIVDYIYNHPRLNHKHRPKARIFNHFDRLILGQIQEKIEMLIYNHKMRLEDVWVQCEGDIEDTIKAWQMKPRLEGIAYEISDAIA